MRRFLQFVIILTLATSAQASTKLFLSQQGSSGSSLTTYKYGNTTQSVLAFTTSVTTKINGTTQNTLTAGGAVAQWVSPPLTAAATIAGTISYDAWVKTSSVTGAPKTVGRVYRLSAGVETQISTKTSTLVQSTSIQHDSFTDAAPTSTVVAIGDRIVIKWFNASTSATGTETLDYGGKTAAADGDSWVSFTENITFDSEPQFIQIVRTGAAASVMPGTTAAGNAIVFKSVTSAAAAQPTVSDGTNSYSLATGPNLVGGNADFRDWIFVACNTTAGGPYTITASGTGVLAASSASEYSGLATSCFDKGAIGSGTSGGTATTSATSATVFANEMVVAAFDADSNGIWTQGTNFIARSPQTNSDPFWEDKAVTSTGTQTGSAAIASSSGWTANVVTLVGGTQPAAGTVVPKMTLLGVGP